MNATVFLVLLLILFMKPIAARAQHVEIEGTVSGEVRAFPRGPRFVRQFRGLQPSLVIEPEVETDFGGNDRIRFVPFVRVDGRDSNRTHFDIRELKWQHFGEGWDVTVGLDRVFWGVTESRHLVDVINQTDFSEDLDGEDKLGQPMLGVRVEGTLGSLRLFVLPGFRERTWAGERGRPGFHLPVDSERAQYESADGDKHVDYAARYSNYWGRWDIGVSYFHGTGREPLLIPNSDGTRLVPVYLQIQQFGLDGQYTNGPWLWKLETIVREGHGSTFLAAVGGFEYTVYGIGESGVDIGLLLEYLLDGRDETAPPTPFDDDVFVGTRIALNDTSDTAVLAGAIIDRHDGSGAVSIEAGRRLRDDWFVEFESRLFLNANPTGVLASYENDSWVTVRLSWFF